MTGFLLREAQGFTVWRIRYVDSIPPSSIFLQIVSCHLIDITCICHIYIFIYIYIIHTTKHTISLSFSISIANKNITHVNFHQNHPSPTRLAGASDSNLAALGCEWCEGTTKRCPVAEKKSCMGGEGVFGQMWI